MNAIGTSIIPGPPGSIGFAMSAQAQTYLAPEDLMNSANAGVIVQRSGHLQHEFSSLGRQFACDIAEFINSRLGRVSVLVYEEAFGSHNQIHALLHLKSLDDYGTLIKECAESPEFRALIAKNYSGKATGTWDRMFVESSLKELVLVPQRWPSHKDAGQPPASSAAIFPPPALMQAAGISGPLIHSANAGLIIQRTAEIKYPFREQAVEFARDIVNYMNANQGSLATVFLYQETFGLQDRIHWLLHMKSLWDYLPLMKMSAGNEEFRNIFLRDRIPAERGGGKWDKMFIDGSFRERVLVPLRRDYATGSGNGAGELARELIDANRRLNESIPQSFTGGHATTDSGPGRQSSSRLAQEVLPPSQQTLNSASSGFIVQQTGQLRPQFRSEGRQFLREMAGYINQALAGTATVLAYEQLFDAQDRMHWFVHLKSIGNYHALRNLFDFDQEFRSTVLSKYACGAWDSMFVDSSLSESAFLPQLWRISGTESKVARPNGGGQPFAFTAQNQTAVPPEKILHSANAGVIIQRVAHLSSRFRSEGREFAREIAECINSKLVGVATVFVYEESFHIHDRIYWLIHLKSLEDYYRLLDLAQRDEDYCRIMLGDRDSTGEGSRTKANSFLEGSIKDVVLLPYKL